MTAADRLSTIFAKGCDGLIANLVTDVSTMRIGPHTVPVTRNDGATPTCYICCPSVAYVDYALDELRHFEAHRALKSTLSGLIRSGRPLMRLAGLDRQVQVNNWLVSTNPAPDWSQTDIDAMRDRLVQDHPSHAVVVRSLNTLADAEVLDRFRQAGFALLPARQIYLFDGRQDRRATRDQRRDCAMLQKTSLQRVGTQDHWSAADYERAASLYDLLYCQKYTPLNPQYSGAFIAAMHQSRLMELDGLRDEAGQLVAINAYFTRARTLTQPLVGYDTAAPQALGLYRLLMRMGQDKAEAEGLIFNMSAGAAGFKRNRGAVPAIEYTAVYVGHLGRAQRAAVAMLAAILNRVGVPLLKRFEL